ncbi:MAG: glycosyltransferase [Chlorobium sp.]|nr:MAG: glycosyltransferase [Chlorobium sp.]
MFLSVIIPVKNSSNNLEKCLDCFYPLHSQLVQIIIVDCCSTDGIDSVLIKHTSLPILHLCGSDDGIYDAFNKGVFEAKGDLVLFMGADDRINLDIFSAVNTFPDNASVLVGGITTNGIVERWSKMLFGIRLLFRNIPHQAMLIRKDMLKEYPYELTYLTLSDYAWNLKHYWSKNINYRFTPIIFCEWAPNGISSIYIDNQFKEIKPVLIKKYAPFLLSLLYQIYRLLFK